MIDALDPDLVQYANLVRRDGAAAPAEHPDVRGAALGQHLDHVAEEFVVAALVGAHGNAVGVFLDGRIDDVAHRTVVAQVHDLATFALYQPAHDVDGRIVAVEKAGGGHEAQRMVGRFRAAGQLLGGLAHGENPVGVSEQFFILTRLIHDPFGARRGRCAARRRSTHPPGCEVFQNTGRARSQSSGRCTRRAR